MRRIVLLGVAAACVATPAVAADLPRKVKPVMFWTGGNSKQSKESFARCSTQKDWEAIWEKHHEWEKYVGDRSCPDVDFDSYMIVAIFVGKGRDMGVRFYEVVEEKDCLRVRYKPIEYQTGFNPNETDAEREKRERESETQSYAFVVLPRSTKCVVLEENAQTTIDAPPVWRERTRFAAMKEK
jgi:hypothetical protein